MGMIDDRESYKREQISKSDEVKVFAVIEDLKLGKLSSHNYLDNFETESDKRNQVDMSDDKESAERDDISKKY